MERYVAAGDRRAFEELFRRYGARLHGFFLRSVASTTEAADLVQQTFLHFHRARRDFRHGALVRPWLYTIAINVRRELFRRRSRKPETSFDPVVHGEPTSEPETTTARDRLVRRALGELPEQQREVILLHWYEELSFPEIAEMLGASVSAVKVRAHRGYKLLRDRLGED
ncbi:MAG: RNA polymerase sigma factor [Deltaproteobacteria bacterium]|nr:RNA polymerase sigma factor [Deltaproteobacteria bacterium]